MRILYWYLKNYAVRGAIGVLAFLSIVGVQGFDTREIQQAFFSLFLICMFSLLLDNIWITLFMLWTVFLYIYFMFNTGIVYVNNIFIGVILYYIVKTFFKRDHIDRYIDVFLWFVVANLAFGVLQLLKFDFYYMLELNARTGTTTYVDNNKAAGFMGFESGLAMLCAISLPLILTRKNKRWFVTLFLIPIFIYSCSSSIAVIASIISVSFVMWHKFTDVFIDKFKISKIYVVAYLSGLLGLGGFLYIKYVDFPQGIMGTRLGQWKLTLHDATIHPITGWGLDSFRNITTLKPYIYSMGLDKVTTNTFRVDKWDNAHNLYIQVFYEFGIIGLILLFGYLRSLHIYFKERRQDLSNNTIGLYGAILAILVVSIAQFPLYLAAFAAFVVPIFALYEIEVTTTKVTDVII